MPSLCAAVQAAVCTESRGQPRLESRWLDQPSEVWIAWSAAVGARAHTLHINTLALVQARGPTPGCLPTRARWWVTRGPRRRRRSARRVGSAEARRCECGGVGFLVCHLEVNNDKMSIVRVPGGGAGLRAREGGGARGGGAAPPAAPTNPLTRMWRKGQTGGGRFSPPPPNPVLATSGPRRLAHPRAQPRARNLTVPPPPILGTLTIP